MDEQQTVGRFDKVGKFFKVIVIVSIALAVSGFWMILPPGLQMVTLGIAGLIAFKIHRSRKSGAKASTVVVIQDETQIPTPIVR